LTVWHSVEKQGNIISKHEMPATSTSHERAYSLATHSQRTVIHIWT